jgi:hypothetical protein
LAQESEAQAAAMEWTSASTEAPPPAPQNIQVKKEHASSNKRLQGKKEMHHQIDSHLNMVKLYIVFKIENYYKIVLLAEYPSTSSNCSVHRSSACR